MKRVYIAFLLAVVLLLSGCATIDEQLENAIDARAAFEDDPDYQEYQQMVDSGQLNLEGVFNEVESINETPSSASPRGQVHVTFASNRYLKIKYYSDAELSTPINQSECYLNPGDTIFASVESKNSISNLYGISKYLVIEYDPEGSIKAQHSYPANSSEVFSIPANFTGTELSIVPIGEYPDRQLSMRAFYMDDYGRENDLANAGKWSINNELCSGNRAAISPIVPYALRFEFDQKNYFFVSSSPSCFTEDPDRAGFVEFWEADPTDEDLEYSVQLHRYLTLSITMEEKATVSINDGEPETIKKGKVWNAPPLRFGDVITIETAGGCTLSSGDFGHVHAARDPISGGNRYTLTIVQDVVTGAADVLQVNEYISLTLPSAGQYGTCTYKLDGKKVSGTITLQLSQKLEVTYTITDSSYKFGDTSFFAGAWNWGQDLFGDMSHTAVIPLSLEMNNTTVIPDSFFTIVEKGA